MKKIKIDSNHVLIGVFILITGIVLGITIGMGETFSLEGSGMATATSATSANATASNATASNATASNATSANAARTDNILYLNNFSLQVESAKPGEKVYIGKMTSGACNSGMSIGFIDPSIGEVFTVNVEDMNEKPYFIVPNNIKSGDYYVAGINLVGLNSDNTTFTKCFQHTTKVALAAGCESHNFDVKLKITNDSNKEVKLDSLSLTEKEGLVGEKVNVNYKASDELTSLKLTFKADNETINVNVLDLAGKPYFNIPSTSKAGEYTLSRVSVMSEDASMVYEGDSNKFDIKLTVKDNSKKTYVYNNSEITDDIIKKLYDDNEVSEITVNVDKSSTISEELFKTIVGTNRKLIINTNGNQIIFDGRDIKNPKTIDVNMTVNAVSKDNKLADTLSDGVVVNFVDNGNLPGNALVRLKVTNIMNNKFGSNRIYVYYYDDVNNGFNLISSGITPKDGYYEFTISHNSKYVLSKTKLADNLILEEEDNNVVDFTQSDNTYLFILCGALVLVLIAIVIILVIKNNRVGGSD